MKIEKLINISAEAWDAACFKMGIRSPWHSWEMLDYYAKSCGADNVSFLLSNDQGELIAICPLFISDEYRPEIGHFRSSSIAGGALPSPLLSRNFDETRIRRNLRELEVAISDICEKNQVVCLRYVYRAYSYVDADSSFFSTVGLGDMLALGCTPTFLQSIAIDLRKNEKILEKELSQYHRKEIRKGEKEGQSVIVVDLATERAKIDAHFAAYQAAHLAAAGRLTRPQASFDAMRNMLYTGHSTLFVNTFRGENISYLYCGHRNGIAFGWSQVNVLPMRVNSPRHFLEWSAIKHYSRQGFVLYDVGPKYYPGQVGVVVTEKLASIGFYKERFGGVLSPEIHYRKFFDKTLSQFELSDDLIKFQESASLRYSNK